MAKALVVYKAGENGGDCNRKGKRQVKIFPCCLSSENNGTFNVNASYHLYLYHCLKSGTRAQSRVVEFSVKVKQVEVRVRNEHSSDNGQKGGHTSD